MLIALGLVAVLTASDPDMVVTKAPTDGGSVLVGAEAPTAEAVPDPQSTAITPHNLTTQQQIDRWLATRSADLEPFADDGPVDDRKMHGFVSGSIGTDDFSAVAVGVSLPVGENGRLDLSYQQVRNGYGLYGPGYGYGAYGYGPGYGYGGGLYGERHGLGFDALEDEPFNAPNPFFGPGWTHAGRDRPREPRTSFGLSYQSREDRRDDDDRR